MKTRLSSGIAAILAGLVLAAACAGPVSSPPPSPSGGSVSQPSNETTARAIDSNQGMRLKRIMVPLLQAANNPRPLNQIRIGVQEDDHINAGSAGEGQFIVTTGLLRKANDRQLAGVLAHEIAHDDLGHVAKAQRLATGLAIGSILLDQIFPGSGQLTPVAGALISRAYGRQEEYQADAHGVDILKRAGYPPQVMEETLTWLLAAEGGSGGGFFATHPATDDRIAALRRAGR